ncbi:hypothetical protein L2E82_01090 [Cichorium intybus]|uniref:Uncharacterized protein n=1 Tax=Cichorium intybus TaxID=13427 RepID=A0ACB9GY07_CICIN|nr:hypothetical protein L2E82_01090 [Cichorium intybus]
MYPWSFSLCRQFTKVACKGEIFVEHILCQPCGSNRLYTLSRVLEWMVQDPRAIDLRWLRDAPPDTAKSLRSMAKKCCVYPRGIMIQTSMMSSRL